MKGTLKIKIGTKQLELTGEGDNKALMKNFSFWSQLPDKCGNCNSTNIALSYRSPKGNDYYGLKCLDCNADLNFGQYKQGGGFFLKNDANWVVWTGAASNNTHQDDTQENDTQENDAQVEVPF